jgi:hypothetical protein
MDLIKLIQDQINQFNQSSLNSFDIDERLGKRVTKYEPSPLTAPPPNTSNYKKKIVQYTLDGQFVREFNSIAEANRFFNLSDKYISKHLRGITKTCAGYYFRYKTE